MPNKRHAAAALAALFLAGCAVGPAYERPAAELPAQWPESAPRGAAVPEARWWTIYKDPALNRLIDEALAHNQDLIAAAARVDEARALAQIADAERLPSVDAGASADRTRSSARSSTPLPPSVPLERTSYRAQANVSYELDLWNRLRNLSDAARAEVLASEAARGTVQLALTAEVARAYFALLALDAQIEATRRTLELRERNLELQRMRREAGVIGEFDLRQLEAEVAAARAQLPAIERSRSAQEASIAVLAGRSPQAILTAQIARPAEMGALGAPVVPSGLPSDLLLRRPDVVEAEQQLIAQNARIGAARAAFFPRISLTGFLGSESAALTDLFSGPARIWQLAFGLAQPVFQGGRLEAEVGAAEARKRQAVALYQKTIQQAFSEVRQALAAQARSREIYAAEGERMAALGDALRLARLRYENGLTAQLEVLDAERNLLQAEINRIEALRATRAAVADLTRALGGGWPGFEPARTGRTDG